MNVKSGGQTLIELLVALGIAAIVIVALVSLTTTSLSNANLARFESDSNRYAREAMEWLRSQRDFSWTTFSSKASLGGTTWCLSMLSWPGSSGTCSGNFISGTSLEREILLTTTSDTEISAVAKVFWTDSKGQHETRLNSIFTRWQ